MGFDEIYEKIKQATTLEVKYQYINFDGKKTNFSKFMIGILYDVLKKINKVEKQNIAQLINLFESYHIDSVHNRRYTIDRTLETFARLRKIIKPKTASEKKETKPTKEFFEEIDEVNVEFVKGVGPQIAKLFNKINIFKVKDLIEYYPRKYVDYQGQNKIRDLKLGEQVSIYGTIIKVNHYTTPNKLTIFTVYIKDSTGVLPINFFLKTNNRKIIESYKQAYPINSMALALGKVKFDDYYSRTTLDKAQIQVLGQGAELDINRNNIVPIYALCENLNPKTLTNAINNALVKFQDKIYDPLPNDIIEKFNFIGKKEAIIDLHKPKNLDEVDVARKRLVFDELFSMQLNLALTQLNLKLKRVVLLINLLKISLLN